jgi:uncharacterized protein (DUF2147 family)
MRSIFNKTCQFASAIFLIGLISTSYLMAQTEGAILGTWFNTEKSAKIEVIKSGTEFVGKIIWIEPDGRDINTILDKENLDPNLRKRPIIGLMILHGFKFKNGIWEGGKIYDPESGKTYSCELKLKNKTILEVKGCVGFSWIGRTVEWSKIM